MDDTETGRRKKRAWRKPREPITPASDPTPAKPIKLQRTAPRLPPGQQPSPVSGAESKGAELVGEEAPQRQDVDTSRHDECKSKPQGGPDALQRPVGGGAEGGGAHQPGHPVHVDGSIMEGVSHLLPPPYPTATGWPRAPL